MSSIRMQTLFGFVASLALAAPAIAADLATPAGLSRAATPIDLPAPRYVRGAATAGGEGWVMVQFCVTADGTTSDHEIVDSVGDQRFHGAVLSALENARYEPATVDGEPTEQCGLALSYQFELVPAETSARWTFVRAYRRAISTLQTGTLEEARAAYGRIDAADLRNLYEQAYHAALRGFIADREGRRAEAARAYRLALRLGPQRLPEKSIAMVALQLLRIEADADNYGGMLKLIDDHLQDLRLDDDARAQVTNVHAWLEQARTDTSRLQTQAQIDRSSWSQRLLKKSFYVEPQAGELQSFELMCDRARRSFDFTTDSVVIPASWGDCTLTVKGTSGAQFTLVQQASPVVASSVDAVEGTTAAP